MENVNDQQLTSEEVVKNVTELIECAKKAFGPINPVALMTILDVIQLGLMTTVENRYLDQGSAVSDEVFKIVDEVKQETLKTAKD